MPGARVARGGCLLGIAPHFPVAGHLQRACAIGWRRGESVRSHVLRARVGGVVQVRPAQLVAVQRERERRVQEVVLERQSSVRETTRRGSDSPIAFEEKALRVTALRRNLEAERDLGAVCNDGGIPQSVDAGLCGGGGDEIGSGEKSGGQEPAGTATEGIEGHVRSWW